MREFWAAVEALDNRVDANTQLAMLIEGRRLVERAARWLVRANPGAIDIAALVDRYERGRTDAVGRAAGRARQRRPRDVRRACAEADRGGVPEELARRVAAMPSMLPVFDIVEVTAATGREPEVVMRDDLRRRHRGCSSTGCATGSSSCRATTAGRRWRAAALRDDLGSLVRVLAQEVLEAAGQRASSDEAVAAWEAEPRDRCRALPRRARRHPGLADVRHDDAAGRAARGSQPRPRRLRLELAWRCPHSRGRDRRRLTRARASHASTTSTSITPATKNAGGPVTRAPTASREHRPSYRLDAHVSFSQDERHRAPRVARARRGRGLPRGGRAPGPAGRPRARAPDEDSRLPQGQGPAPGRDPPARPRGGARRGAARVARQLVRRRDRRGRDRADRRARARRRRPASRGHAAVVLDRDRRAPAGEAGQLQGPRGRPPRADRQRRGDRRGARADARRVRDARDRRAARPRTATTS